MELGVSALTRRDRLERIASAERDRRAGRIDLAIAVLGESTEWPARVVLALARLAADEGDETRSILERSLDDWAAESGLDPLDATLDAIPAEAASEPEVEEDSDSVGPQTEIPIGVGPSTHGLDAPIANDELERAFAEAEAQTDEMHDVNRVAERVLMDEPVGLAELVSEPEPEPEPEAQLVPEATSLPEEEILEVVAADTASVGIDAAWAEASVWPEPISLDASVDASFDASVDASVDALVEEPVDEAAHVVLDGTAPAEGLSDEQEQREHEGDPSRGVILATLERWLVNIEKSRAGDAR